MKHDFSDRSHEQARPGKPGEMIERTLINLSGIPADYAYEHGSQQERSDLKALGAILLGSSALTSITATVGLHLALGDGGFHPWYAAMGIFVGALTGAIDYTVQYKGTLASRGLSENRRAGLKLPDSESTSRLSFFVRLVRVGQAATFGFLGGMFLIIATNFTDVHSYIDNKFTTLNRPVAEEAAKLTDAAIARNRQALSVLDAEINNLSRLIQAVRLNDVKRAVGRKANAPPPTSNPQLEALERQLAETTVKRDAVAATLSNQEGNRNAAIEKAINASPNVIRKRTGLAAQLEALSALTDENPRLILVFLALELLSLALELGPMWAAASRIPSALAGKLALDHFVLVSERAKEGAEKLGVRAVDDHPVTAPIEAQAAKDAPPPTAEVSPQAANDSAPPSPSESNGAAPPPRWPRSRGTSGKSGLEQPPVGGAGHE
jgi:Domain of unknown function (DUF4407)